MAQFAEQKTILVIDLIAYGPLYYPNMIKRSGFLLLVADSIREGLMIAREVRPYCVVIMDLYLTKDSNYAFRELKSHQALVIGLTDQSVVEKFAQEIECDAIFCPGGNFEAVLKYLHERLAASNGAG